MADANSPANATGNTVAPPAQPAQNKPDLSQSSLPGLQKKAEPQSEGTIAPPVATKAQAAQLKDIANDPKAAPAAKAAAKQMLKSLKIKVDGQEFEEKLPFEIEDTKANRDWMTKELQMSRVASKRMGEKSQLESEVRTFLEQLKTNPRKVLADPSIGIDLKKIAAEMINEEIANAQKSPEQLKQEQLEEQLRELREKSENEKKAFEAREFERIQQMEYDRYDTLMTQALEKSDLPKSPYVVKKMADYMMMGLKEGYDVTPEDVLPLVREEILADIRSMSQAMPIETLEKLFGGDILQKVRKSNVAKAKAAPQGQTGKPKLPDVGSTAKAKTKDVADKDKMNYKRFFGI